VTQDDAIKYQRLQDHLDRRSFDAADVELVKRTDLGKLKVFNL
jgi:hypothetical protein